MGLRSLLWVLPCLSLVGCISVRVGANEPFLQSNGLAFLQGSLQPMEWNGNLLDVGLWTREHQRSEVLTINFGPIGSFGLGVLGARVRVLPVELGVGAFFYDPTAHREEEAEGEKPAEGGEEKPGGRDITGAASAPAKQVVAAVEPKNTG